MREVMKGINGDKEITIYTLRELQGKIKEIFDVGYIADDLLIMIRGKKYKLVVSEIINYLNKNNYHYKEIVLNYSDICKDSLNDVYIKR